MAETQLARGLWTGFAATENPFSTPNGMDENLRTIDDHLALYTLQAPLAAGSALPSNPIPGAGQIFADGSYAVFNAGSWKTYAPRSGIMVMHVDGSEAWQNTGSGWVKASVLDVAPAIAAAKAEIEPIAVRAETAAQQASNSAQVAITSGSNEFTESSWTDLLSKEASAVGKGGTVRGDTGSHVDPVKTGSQIVPNEGVFAYRDPGLWEWMGPLPASKNDVEVANTKRIEGDQTIRFGFDGMVAVDVDDADDYVPVGYIDPETGESPLGIKPSTGELVARISASDPGVIAGIDKRAAQLIPGTTFVYDGIGPIIPFSVNEKLEVLDGINIETGERIGAGASSGSSETHGYILVWAIGQSNTSGRATTKSSYTFSAGEAYKYVRSSASLALLADPTGNDSIAQSGRGSWAPAFADTIRRLSGGRIGVIVVNSAEGGTPISPNWLAGGTQWTQASTDLDSALSAAAALKLPIVGCCVYMQQGETDGDNGVSTADYVTRYASLTELVDNKIGVKVPFLMTRIGTKNTGDTAAYAAIRAAQNQIAETVDGVYLVHTGTVDFADRGLMMDTFHYTIDGYDEIGATAGAAAFSLALGVRPLGYSH